MGQKVFNTLSITGFADEAARSKFKTVAAKSQIPFSFERLLPLDGPEEIERECERLYRELHPEETEGNAARQISEIDFELKWGSWIYEAEGHSESVNNKLEELCVADELGLFYCFESRNDPPFNGIRQLSRRYPELLFKMYSEDDAPDFGFSVYKNGKYYSTVFEQAEFDITRAAEWPFVAAISPDNRLDAALHRFLRDAADKLRGCESFDEELADARDEERRKIKEQIEFYKDMLRRRRE